MDKKQYLKEYYAQNKRVISERKALWYKKNRKDRLKKNAVYYQTHKEVLNEKRKKYPSYSIKYGTRKYKYKYVKRPYTAEYKEKQHVRYLVRQAVAKGVLIRLPCAVCKAIKVQAHHVDYAKPLEVMWLCQKHHSENHQK